MLTDCQRPLVQVTNDFHLYVLSEWRTNEFYLYVLPGWRTLPEWRCIVKIAFILDSHFIFILLLTFTEEYDVAHVLVKGRNLGFLIVKNMF